MLDPCNLFCHKNLNEEEDEEKKKDKNHEYEKRKEKYKMKRGQKNKKCVQRRQWFAETISLAS